MPEKSLKAIIGILFTITFLSVCEIGKPLARSAIIAFCISFSTIFNRRQSVLTSLIWSLVILTLIYPFCIFEAGVQLSYAAISGVVLGSMCAKKFDPSDLELQLLYTEPSYLSKAKQFFVQSFFCSLGAFIFITPIQYYWFNTFSLYSLPFNICFALLFSYLVVLPGFFVLIVIWTCPSLGIFSLKLHSYLVIGLINTINYLWVLLK